MNWYEQTSNMMKLWSQSQEQMLSQWVKAVSPAAETESNHFVSMNEIWQQTMFEGIQRMNQQMDSTAQDIIQKLFASQMTTMQLLELSMQTWQAVLPSIQSGEGWQAALDKQMIYVRNQIQQFSSGSLNSMNNMQQLWNKYLGELNSFGAPWLKSMQDSNQYYERFLKGDSSALIEMTSLYNDAFHDSFGSYLQMPGLGYTREMDAKVRHSFASWIEMQQASYEYQLVVVEAWLEAFERLIKELGTLAEKGESIDSVRDFLNRWSSLADETFKKTFHSEQYIKLQGKYINTLMEYRNKQRQMNEMFMEYYDLPTRSEVDETNRRIYELRKEIRSLKREIADLKAEQKPAAKKPATRKKSSS